MTFSADDLDESNARQIEKTEGFVCTHEDVTDIGLCDYGCCERFECLDCAVVLCEVPE